MYILDNNGDIVTLTDSQGNIIKQLEYRYLEYNSDGYVVAIYNEEPVISNGNNIAIADNINFEEGYEFENYIVVQEVNDKKTLTSSYMIKQPESVKYLRSENIKLKKQNTDLMLALTEMVEVTEQEKTEMQLAIAELAELLGGM